MLYQIFENVKKARKKILPLSVKGSVLPTKAEHRRMALPAFIGSIIGVVVGIVPGTGRGHFRTDILGCFKRVSKHPEEYGDSSIEGLATTCASNNASIGGALTTALALGIPGTPARLCFWAL